MTLSGAATGQVRLPAKSSSPINHQSTHERKDFFLIFPGIESFSKIGDSIYFEDKRSPSLYIVQYTSSSLNWKSGGLTVNQKVQPVSSQDAYLRMELTFSSNDVSRLIF